MWKLKQAETKGIFSERVQTRAVLASDDYVELWMLKKAWKDLKDRFLEEAVDDCGNWGNTSYC